jgi:hypothetical protein
MLIATSAAAKVDSLPRRSAKREGRPTMKLGAPVPSNTAIDSIDQENFKAW